MQRHVPMHRHVASQISSNDSHRRRKQTCSLLISSLRVRHRNRTRGPVGKIEFMHPVSHAVRVRVSYKAINGTSKFITRLPLTSTKQSLAGIRFTYTVSLILTPIGSPRSLGENGKSLLPFYFSLLRFRQGRTENPYECASHPRIGY